MHPLLKSVYSSDSTNIHVKTINKNLSLSYGIAIPIHAYKQTTGLPPTTFPNKSMQSNNKITKCNYKTRTKTKPIQRNAETKKKRKRMNLEKWGWQRIDQTRQAQAYYQPRPMIHWNTEKTLFF